MIWAAQCWNTFILKKQRTSIGVSKEFFDLLKRDDGFDEYPVLGHNTSQDDLNEALYVLRQDAYTHFDLELYRIGEEDPNWDDDIPTEGVVQGETKHQEVMSKMGRSMQDGMKLS